MLLSLIVMAFTTKNKKFCFYLCQLFVTIIYLVTCMCSESQILQTIIK